MINIDRFHLAWDFSHCSKIVENSGTKKRRNKYFCEIFLNHIGGLFVSMKELGLNALPYI
jgi:hypothetical protein